MDSQQLKTAKMELENTIFHIVKNFNEDTGLRVDRINLPYVDATNIGESERLVLCKVSAECVL